MSSSQGRSSSTASSRRSTAPHSKSKFSSYQYEGHPASPHPMDTWSPGQKKKPPKPSRHFFSPESSMDPLASSRPFHLDAQLSSHSLPQSLSPSASDSEPSDEEIVWDCPLCMEEVDYEDARFTPCECGYQICRFCWHHIKSVLNDRCPACRRSYSEQEDSPLVLVKPLPRKTCKLHEKRKHAAFTPPPVSSSVPADPSGVSSRGGAPIGNVLVSRRHLVDVRVLQQNLVYVIGIPLSEYSYIDLPLPLSSQSNSSLVVALEHLLASKEYFGKYGDIIKLVINLKGQHSGSKKFSACPSVSSVTTVSAFLTFERQEDASFAIESIDGTNIDGYPLRATYGTTKYCAFFLRGQSCPNQSFCLYLHDLGEEHNSYTKESLASRQRDNQLKRTLSNGTEIITHTLPRRPLENIVVKGDIRDLPVPTKKDPSLASSASSVSSESEFPTEDSSSLESIDNILSFFRHPIVTPAASFRCSDPSSAASVVSCDSGSSSVVISRPVTKAASSVAPGLPSLAASILSKTSSSRFNFANSESASSCSFESSDDLFSSFFPPSSGSGSSTTMIASPSLTPPPLSPGLNSSLLKDDFFPSLPASEVALHSTCLSEKPAKQTGYSAIAKSPPVSKSAAIAPLASAIKKAPVAQPKKGPVPSALMPPPQTPQRNFSSQTSTAALKAQSAAIAGTVPAATPVAGSQSSSSSSLSKKSKKTASLSFGSKQPKSPSSEPPQNHNPFMLLMEDEDSRAKEIPSEPISLPLEMLSSKPKQKSLQKKKEPQDPGPALLPPTSSGKPSKQTLSKDDEPSSSASPPQMASVAVESMSSAHRSFERCPQLLSDPYLSALDMYTNDIFFEGNDHDELHELGSPFDDSEGEEEILSGDADQKLMDKIELYRLAHVLSRANTQDGSIFPDAYFIDDSVDGTTVIGLDSRFSIVNDTSLKKNISSKEAWAHLLKHLVESSEDGPRRASSFLSHLDQVRNIVRVGKRQWMSTLGVDCDNAGHRHHHEHYCDDYEDYENGNDSSDRPDEYDDDPGADNEEDIFPDERPFLPQFSPSNNDDSVSDAADVLNESPSLLSTLLTCIAWNIHGSEQLNLVETLLPKLSASTDPSLAALELELQKSKQESEELEKKLHSVIRRNKIFLCAQ